MTAKTTRLLKEARPLFWPWCAVILASALPLVRPLHSIEWVTMLGYFLGLPLLAALALGNEFQHRTISLLLSQPVDRMEIWREKLVVSVVAVLSAALVFYASVWGGKLLQHPDALALIAASVIATLTSSAFWVLVGRSTVGGIVLTIAAQLFIVISTLTHAMKLHAHEGFPAASHAANSSAALVLLCYAGLMLWFGRRKLARFQLTGGMAGEDLLTAGPGVMPKAVAGWFRSRPAGAVLNLFRKEFGLQRPVWLFTVLAALGWTWLTVASHHHGARTSFQIAVVSVGVVCTLVIAILAGTVPLGEERTSGTHAWHLTLPPSALLQWSVKLGMALFAGFIGAWLLPALIAGRSLFISSTPPMWGRPSEMVLLATVLILTFTAFWCACAVNGTVAAVLWVAPVAMVLGFAIHFAERWGQELVRFVAISLWQPIETPTPNWLTMIVGGHYDRMLSLFGNLRFDWWVTSITFPQPLPELWYRPFRTPAGPAALLGGPALILALVQSYRLFRAQPRDNVRPIARNLWPLTLLVFLCGFSVAAWNGLRDVVGLQVPAFLGTTSGAIQKALPEAAREGAKAPLELTLDDVAKAYWTHRRPRPYSLPATTRRWLTGARITVVPDKAYPGGFYCEGDQLKGTWCYYSATIHLADGTEIFLQREPEARSRPAPPGFGHLSVSVRWPGATKQEFLWER